MDGSEQNVYRQFLDQAQLTVGQLRPEDAIVDNTHVNVTTRGNETVTYDAVGAHNFGNSYNQAVVLCCFDWVEKDRDAQRELIERNAEELALLRDDDTEPSDVVDEYVTDDGEQDMFCKLRSMIPWEHIIEINSVEQERVHR